MARGSVLVLASRPLVDDGAVVRLAVVRLTALVVILCEVHSCRWNSTDGAVAGAVRGASRTGKKRGFRMGGGRN